MAKSTITKNMKIEAFPNSGKELKMVPTYFLSVELAFIDLSGLITRRILKGFKFTLIATISIILKMLILIFLPCYNDQKIHDIPRISHKCIRFHNESHSKDFYKSFCTKYECKNKISFF